MNKSSLDPSLKLRHKKKLRPINKKILFLILLISSCLLKNENIKAMEDAQLIATLSKAIDIKNRTLKLNDLNLTQENFNEILVHIASNKVLKILIQEINICSNPQITMLPNQILWLPNLKTIYMHNTSITEDEILKFKDTTYIGFIYLKS